MTPQSQFSKGRLVRRFGPASAVFAAVLLAACAGDGTELEPEPEAPVEEPVLEPTTASVQAALVNRHCLKCHRSPSEVNRRVQLRDISLLTEAPAEDSRQLIRPGCPEQSLFYSVLVDQLMPPEPAAPLSMDDIAVVHAWIYGLVSDAERDCSDPDEPGTDPPDPDEPF